MASSEQRLPSVTPFPLIGAETSEAAALVAIIRRLSVARSLPEIMEVTTHAARTLLHADGVTFVLRDGDFCHYVEEDAIAPLWKGCRFPLDACISGWCMTHGQAAVIQDIRADERIPQDAYRSTFVRSLAMVPVRQEAPIAAMGAYWSTVRQPAAEEVELLQTIANAAALAIAFVQLQQQTDGATPRVGVGVRALPGRWVQRGKALVAGWRLPAWNLSAPTHADEAEGDPPATHPWRDWLRPNSPQAYLFAAGCVGVAIGVRWGLGIWAHTPVAPFVTYFPAVLLSAFVGGTGCGLLASALAVASAWWAFLPPEESWSLPDAVNLGTFILALALVVWTADGHRRSYSAVLTEQSRRLLLMRELQHRIRNVLTVVQGIVQQSLRASPVQAAAINRRIEAFVHSSHMVAALETEPASLKQVVLGELEPYDPSRVILLGQDLVLPPPIVHALGLSVHELATNAAKYGALSVPTGRLFIAWTARPSGLEFSWRERGGPPVAEPGRRGFGTRFMASLLRQVGATVETEFLPEGLVCRIFLPPGYERG